MLAVRLDEPGLALRWSSLARQEATADGAEDNQAVEAIDRALDGFIESEGLDLADGDRDRLRPHFLAARQQAYADLQRASRGDYTPFPEAARFPERILPKLDLHTAFDEYVAKGGRKGGAEGRTAKRWKPKIHLLTKWLGHRDLAKMTPDDAYRWVDHLIDEKFDRKSIKDVWIASLSAVAGFIIERRKLKTTNPFYGIRVRDEITEVEDATPPRQKGFTQKEAVATAQFPQTLRASPQAKASSAIRWPAPQIRLRAFLQNDLPRMRNS